MRRPEIKHRVVAVLSYLFILLFVYAAVSKLLDFENFQVQIGQSPMLSAHAGFVSVAVIVVELIAALMLVFERSRIWGLYLCFTLMLMFTTYIVIILNYSAFVPCACGGVIDSLGWKAHLILNLCFVLVAMLGIYLENIPKHKIKSIGITLATLSILGIAVVVAMYISSEAKLYERNNFIRRYPPNAVVLKKERDLELNSYTVAGLDATHIYLSNVTAPLNISVLNHDLELLEQDTIKIPDPDSLFKMPQVQVVPPHFYFTDGFVPVLMGGSIENWRAEIIQKEAFYFTKIRVADSSKAAIKFRSSKTNEDALGMMALDADSTLQVNTGLLEKQIDGVFDVDGTLIFNQELGLFIYTYYYRNSFILFNKQLELIKRFNTIDTISKAQIDIRYLTQRGYKKMGKPPLVVNRHTATYGTYMFVNSNIMGLYEPESSWKRNSVIDVYDLRNGNYVQSIYLPKIADKGITEFYIREDVLICMVGNYIRSYQLTLAFNNKSF